MRVLRDWLAWAAVWVLVVESPMWVALALDAWQERTDPTLEPMAVPSWVPPLAYVAGVAVPLGLVLVVAGVRSRVVQRVGLLVGAAGLAVGAIAFRGVPGTGDWYVALTALAACGAVLAAVTPGLDSRPRPSAAVLPGVALVLASLFTAVTCWRGGSYWSWSGESAVPYAVGLVVSVLFVGLGATAARWIDLRSRVLQVLLVVPGLLGGILVLAGADTLHDNGALYRWEEIESPWDYGTAYLLLGTGLVATAVAALRRRGDLAAWSLVAGPTFLLLSLWQQPTWGRLMS